MTLAELSKITVQEFTHWLDKCFLMCLKDVQKDIISNYQRSFALPQEAKLLPNVCDPLKALFYNSMVESSFLLLPCLVIFSWLTRSGYARFKLATSLTSSLPSAIFQRRAIANTQDHHFFILQW